MRLLSLILLFGSHLPVSLWSDEPTPDAAAVLLRAAQNPDVDFFSALDAAREAGVSEARMLEARLAKMLQTGDLRGLLTQIEAIESLRDGFSIGFDPSGESLFAFASPRQVTGLVEALKAIKAYQAGDLASFEAHAKTAFWEWPQWVELFQVQRLIQEARGKEVLDAYVADLVLPLDLPLRDLEGQSLTLGDLAKDHQAVLLDFWASWCGPCIRLMPELQAKADQLRNQGIHVVAINTDKDDPLAKAAKVKEEHSMDMPWLVEADGQPISQTLMIDSIPRMVLLSPEGRILFNGHPLDDALSEALGALGASMN
jgi:thiol-disulfide isomerase/thioredoxin